MLARVMIPFALTVATVAANPTGILRCGQGSIIRSVTPECTWSLSGTQFAYQLQLFHISDSETPIYATRRVESPSPRHQIPTSAGVRPGNSYILRLRYWNSTDRGIGSMWSTLQFHVALLTQNDWNEAAWLGSEKLNRYRVDFNAPADAAAVHVYVCGLGYSRVTLNGGKHVLDLDIGDQVLTTAPWTNNAKTNGFTTVDITHQLRPGSNTIGVELGHGWRDQQSFPIKDPTDMPGTGSISRVVRAIVIAQLANGTSQVVTHTGDGSWQASAGPVTADSVYNGEECDGRIALQQHGWDRPQPERQETTNDWAQAPVSSAPPQGLMVPWMAPPVRIAEKISPVKIWKPKQHPDVFVVDFGVNVAGVCRIRGINGATGQIIKLRHAEILQHTGLPDLKSVVDPEMIYTGNLRGELQEELRSLSVMVVVGAQATDVYTLHGSGEEWYMPTQTYHGKHQPCHED